MKCYWIISEAKENAIFIQENNMSLIVAECPDDKIELADSIIKKWEMEENVFWECVARSDNGIDDRRSDSHVYPIRFEDLVFDGEKFVGVYIAKPNCILYFDKHAKQSIIVNSEEFLGGWGDVSEGYSYFLSEKSDK